MRIAGDKLNLYEKLKNFYASELGTDVIETSAKTAGVAATQALATDMTPEEIALAALIGSTASMAVRPIGKFAGGRIGRYMDDGIVAGSSQMDRSVALNEMQRYIDKGKSKAKDHIVGREVMDVIEKRMKGNYADSKGNYRGDMEAMLGEIARESIDDVALVGLGFAMPQLFKEKEAE